MQINAELIRSERLKRAWSQEQLAQVAGLGVRTVQRMESGGSASLETVKSLAAVLELPAEALLIEAPRLPFWRRPLNLVASAGAAALVLFIAVALAPKAMAKQVELSMAVQRNDEPIAQPRVITQDGQPASVVLEQKLKILVKPKIMANNTVMIQLEIYYFDNGEWKLDAKPELLANDGKAVQVQMKGPDRDSYNFSLTPQILTSQTH
ncbi:MAG TPA: helix-turn-helix transcriptional regulator [Candidatus Acidoferrum sp.]|nr:helix-turn-helix transcriptional regulator [Candidatus Acidoferrum sp.]